MDSLWTSCPFSAAIDARLEAHPGRHPHIALDYPKAGHHVAALLPYEPARLDLYQHGVSPLDDDDARAEAWPKVLDAILHTG